MPGFCASNCLMSSSTSVTLLWKKYCQYVMVTGCCPAPRPDMVSSMIAAITIAETALTKLTSKRKHSLSGWYGALRGMPHLNPCANASLRGAQRRSNLHAGDHQAPSALAMTENRFVIARPRSGRSNLILTQDDSIGLLATSGTIPMLKLGPFQHVGKNVLRLHSYQQESHRPVHGDHERPFKADVGTSGGSGLEIREPVLHNQACVLRGFRRPLRSHLTGETDQGGAPTKESRAD